MADALPISGQIDPKAFPFLLVDLHRQGATGSLKVEGPTHQKALYLRGGRILFGSSNDPKDQLGAILVESGKVTAEQLDDVNKKVGPGNPLAKALSDSGIVSQRELSEAARAKVERILSDVLSYPSGSFEFEDGVLPKGAVDLKLSTERLFVTAVRRITDRGFVLRHLEGLDVVLKPSSGMDERIGEVQSETSGLEGQLDGSRSLKEAASRSGIEEFEAAKIACALVFLKLLEPGDAVGGGAEGDSLNPFFVESSGGGSSAEIDLGGDAPTMPFGGMEEDAGTRPMQAVVPEMSAESTLVMGDSPISFTFPGPEATSAPEVVAESEVAPPPAFVAPEPEPPPPPPPVSPSGPPPLKIIAPPKVGDRTRPPTKATKDDLAALDVLLKNKSVEGPLAPLSKEPEDRWEPSFLPEKKPHARHRHKKHRDDGAGKKKLMLVAGGIAALLAAAAGGYWYLTREPVVPVKLAQASPKPVAPSPVGTPAAGASTVASPAAAAASPGVASAPASPGAGGAATSAGPASPSPAPAAATGKAAPTPSPAVAAAKPTPTPIATPSAKPTPTPVPARPAPATPASAPAPAKATAAAPAAGGVANARAAFRRGQFQEAARGFLANAQAARAGYTIQLLVACSDETIQKATASVAAEELFILPVHYRGRDCYRMLWGLYDEQKRAEAAVRSVPAYFREGGATPKAVPTASILK